MSELIITHPGSAHFDEFLAICLILASNPDREFRVERREPSKKELSDPSIWVIDIGEQLDHDLKNFDHHQNIDLQASFVLIADYLNLTETLSNLTWWQFKDRIDRFGPVRTGAEIGAENLRCTYSPFEEWYLERFASDPNETLPLMKLFGIHVMKTARKMASQLKFWEKAKKVEIKGHTVLIGHTDSTAGSQEYNDSLAKKASVIVTYDSRGRGWKLCRFDDFPGVDFSAVADNDAIKFAHKTGFVAKTHERLPIEEVLDLVRQAIPD